MESNFSFIFFMMATNMEVNKCEVVAPQQTEAEAPHKVYRAIFDKARHCMLYLSFDEAPAYDDLGYELLEDMITMEHYEKHNKLRSQMEITPFGFTKLNEKRERKTIPEPAMELYQYAFSQGCSDRYCQLLCEEFVSADWLTMTLNNTILYDEPYAMATLEYVDSPVCTMDTPDYVTLKLWYSKGQRVYKRFTPTQIKNAMHSIYIANERRIQQILWRELCEICSWQEVDRVRYRDNRLMVLLRKKLLKEQDKRKHGDCMLFNHGADRRTYVPLFRKVPTVCPDNFYYENFAMPEMDAVTDSQVNVETSNVVLAETNIESHDEASIPVFPSWNTLCTTEAETGYDDLTDRFLQWKTTKWTLLQKTGDVISDDILPYAFTTSYKDSSGKASYCTTPNFIPFNIKTYWRGDMHIKIQINSNQFQCGMLIASWLYASDAFRVLDVRQDVYSMVQQPHAIISAGASNEITLVVPYRHVKPFLRSKNIYKNTAAQGKNMNMGRLRVAVLSPLQTGTAATSPTEADLTYFISFPKSKFTGMVAGDLAQPEMAGVSGILGTIGKVAGTVDKVIKDINCDNPPSTRPGQFLVPLNCQSWSHGTNAYEPINTLRLDGGRIGVGRSGDIGYSDTAMLPYMQIWGLLKPIIWTSTDKSKNKEGYMLWWTSNHPQVDKERVYHVTTPDKLHKYSIPPVGVISSLFCWWRGTLEYRFDVVATSKHTGRLLVAYIPGINDASKVTIQQAKASPYIVFSLDSGTNSFTFRVPYIGETPFWPRKYGGPQRASNFIAPSCIVMFVLNGLIPMESVSQQIEILPYIRGGDDFEVAIPAQPAIGLGENITNVIPSYDYVEFKSGYYPVYTGTWHTFQNGKCLIFRYGPTSDHVAQLTEPGLGNVSVVYECITRPLANMRTKIQGEGSLTLPDGMYTAGYGVIYNDGGQYKYMIPYPNDEKGIGLQNATRLAKYLYDTANHTPNDVEAFKWLPQYMNLESDYTAGNLTWRPVTNNVRLYRRSLSDYAMPEMQGVTIERQFAPNVMNPTEPLRSTAGGKLLYGEQFTDMKDLCRRYQLYYETTITPAQLRANRRNSALLQVPVFPHGLDLQPSLNSPVSNSMREGHIPIICSGYRFYRGGVRFRIVVTGFNDSIWVQHHPDRPVTSNLPIIGKNIQDRDAYRNHTYAFWVQNMTVNRTIEVEIPFYQVGLYGLLNSCNYALSTQSDDAHLFSSLGDMVIGIEGDQEITKLDIAIYYSLADDCSLNIPIGFPLMVYTDEVFKPVQEVAKPEMMGVSFISSAVTSAVGTLAGRMAVSGVKAIAEPIKTVVRDEVKANVSPMMDELQATVQNAAKDVNEVLNMAVPQQAIISALGQFSQIALNPSPLSVAVGVITLLSQFVTVSLDLVVCMQDVLVQYLTRVWKKYFQVSSDLQGDPETATPEGFIDEMDDKTLHGFLGMVLSAVAATVGVSCKSMGTYPNLMKGVRESLNVCNASVIFFRNCVEAIMYMYRYCLGQTSEELQAKIILEREYPHMRDWSMEVCELLDPRAQNTILHSTRHANRVFDACMYGSKLINNNLDKNIPGGKILYDQYTKICKLRDDIIELGNHPDVRFEAFPIWVSGPAGIGKTFITNAVCKELLSAIDYQTKECMIYWLALGQKYWNGCKNPPVIARDEAYAVAGTFTEEEIATHLAICSSSILNPPMAAVHEKNKRLNPLIYYMNSNLEFPAISEARCPQAIYRRRKVMVRADFTDDVKQRYPGILDASELPPNEKVNSKHLVFKMALDPKDPNTQWTNGMTYDSFLRIAKERFVEHVHRERENFKARMQAAYALDPSYNENDNLNFVHESQMPETTLHEIYLRERNLARDVLAGEPPSSEDSYIQSILNRFAYLWSPPAQGEMAYDNDKDQRFVPSTSKSSADEKWFKENRRGLVEYLQEVTKLDRGACQKILQGGAVCDNADIDALTPSPLLKSMLSKDIRLRYSVHPKRISMFPDSWVKPLRQCGWGLGNNGRSDYDTSFIPYWENLTGTDAIRSFVYWKFRERQIQAHVKALEEQYGTGELQRVIEESFPEAGTKLTREMRDKLLSGTFEVFDEVYQFVDHGTIAEIDDLIMLMQMLRMMDGIVENSSATWCEHCKFWVAHMHNTRQLEYSPRYDSITYVNGLGLRSKFETKCVCHEHNLLNNVIFVRCMKIVWNFDHGLVENSPYNPFTSMEYKRNLHVTENFLQRSWEYVKDWWRFVGLPFVSMVLTFLYEHFGKIVAVLLGLYGIYKMYQGYGPTVEGLADAASRAAVGALVGAGLSTVFKEDKNATPESANYFKMDKAKPAKAPPTPAAREGSVDPAAVIENKIQNNTCWLIMRAVKPSGEFEERHGKCLALKERKILVIRHYLEEFSGHPGANYILQYNMGGRECSVFLTKEHLENVRWIKINGMDNKSNFGVLELPKFCPQFKDITSSIPSIKEFNNVGSVANLYNFDIAKGKMHAYGLPLEYQAYIPIAGADFVSQIDMDISFRYPVRGSGMCGSALVAMGCCRGNPGIIGLHVAGTRGDGLAEPICREMFAPELQEAPKYIIPAFDSVEKASVNLDMNLLLLGTVTDDFAHHESGKTKIVPSLLYGKIYDVKTEPNPLKPNDPRQPPGSHPLRDGCNKHGSGYSIPFEQKYLDEVSNDQREVLLNKCKQPLAEMRELTLQEAVCGTQAIPHCEALNWNSSEGYPLSSLRPQGQSSKKYLFDLKLEENGYQLQGIDPRLNTLLTTRAELRRMGKVLPPIYIDCLKDYRLPPEKCKIPGKTRIFSIAPIQTTLDIRRYMGLFLSAYRSATIYGQHGIGINPDSVEWTYLAQYLLSVGNNIVVGDYSNFGPTLSSQVVWHVIKDILYWHEMNGASEEHIMHLQSLLENEILNPIHLCENLVYQTVNGIASGSPITAELNSEANKYYVKLAFLELVDKLKLNYTLKDFNDKCRLVTYGDDLIMSVHDDFIEWFNCQTISECLKAHGITLTDITKTGEVVKFRRLHDATFLKRTFKDHPYRREVFLAPIEVQSVTECLNWCHKQPDMKAATEEVVRASCELAFGHGPLFYQNHINKIRKVCVKNNIEFSAETWATLDKRNLGG